MRQNNWKTGAYDTARSLFPAGTRIEEISSRNDKARRGVVKDIEPTGVLHVIWDNKTESKIILGIDNIRKLRPNEIEEEKRIAAPQWFEMEVYTYTLCTAIVDYCKKLKLPFEYEEYDKVYYIKIKCTEDRAKKFRKWLDKRFENEGKFADLEFSM